MRAMMTDGMTRKSSQGLGERGEGSGLRVEGPGFRDSGPEVA